MFCYRVVDDCIVKREFKKNLPQMKSFPDL